MSIQPPTQTQYLKYWNNFCAFLTNDLHLAYTATITPQHVALFITSLHQRPLAYKTIRTYITALSFVLKLKFDTDATVSPLVARTLSGFKASSSPRAQTRPITKNLLHKLLDAIPLCTYAAYLRSLYKALFLVTYYACLRSGEVVLSTNPKHVFNIEQVFWDKQLSYFELSFSSFKHSQQRTTIVLWAGTAYPPFYWCLSYTMYVYACWPLYLGVSCWTKENTYGVFQDTQGQG